MSSSVAGWYPWPITTLTWKPNSHDCNKQSECSPIHCSSPVHHSCRHADQLPLWIWPKNQIGKRPTYRVTFECAPIHPLQLQFTLSNSPFPIRIQCRPLWPITSQATLTNYQPGYSYQLPITSLATHVAVVGPITNYQPGYTVWPIITTLTQKPNCHDCAWSHRSLWHIAWTLVLLQLSSLSLLCCCVQSMSGWSWPPWLSHLLSMSPPWGNSIHLKKPFLGFRQEQQCGTKDSCMSWGKSREDAKCDFWIGSQGKLKAWLLLPLW